MTLDAAATFVITELGLSADDWEDWFPKPRLPPWDDPRKVTRYSDAVLQPLRQRGDPGTDPIIDMIAATGQSPRQAYEKVHAFFVKLIRRRVFVLRRFRNSVPQDAFAALERWQQDTRAAQPKLDRARVLRAARFFKDHFFAMGIVLSTSSLLEAYASHRGVKVLARTKELSKHTNRRLAETLQFVLYVCAREGFTGNGHAIAAIQKVRLMHAAIRWLVTHNPRKKWDRVEYGVPINREDLLGVLMSFSTLPYRDLPKLLIPVSYEEADDYRYLWNAIGAMLGNEVALLPKTVGEALALTMAIERRHQAWSLEGVEMAAALVAYHRHFLKEWVDSIGVLVMRWLAGDAVCDMVEIPPVSFGAGLGSEEVLGTVRDWGIDVWSHRRVKIGDLTADPYDIPPSLGPLWKGLDDANVGWNGS
ncbi:MAG TPA: oxygenase MpaB family protein [Candidatus Limnocylindria bacterium]|nr:oxygenase MpaB family protein [Candidatus Limnocylindria bacterium]